LEQEPSGRAVQGGELSTPKARLEKHRTVDLLMLERSPKMLRFGAETSGFWPLLTVW